jgi:uncharacterized lipoprotein YddW (UPF0748 family)
MRNRLLTAAALSLTFLFPLHGGVASAQEVKRDLWLDIAQLESTDTPMLQHFQDQPIRRVIVTAFRGGETLFPTESTLFSQMPSLRGKGDLLADLVAQGHRNGKEVYVYLDCFFWTPPGTPDSRDVLLKHGELAERNREGGCGLPAAGKYASPFHPQVRKALHDLIEEIARRYPKLDGVVLRCGLPLGAVLGFSDVSRAAYIRARQLDPLDFADAGDAATALTGEWMNWRTDQVAQVVKDLSTTFKAAVPKGKVLAFGYANWYRLPMDARNATLDDWLTWANRRWIDEVLLDCRWMSPENRDAYSYCATLIGKIRNPVPLTPVLPLRDGHEVLNPAASWQVLRGQAVPAVVLRVGDPRDWERVPGLWTQMQNPSPKPPVGEEHSSDRPRVPSEETKPPLPSLRTDPRLAVRLTLDLKSPKLPTILEQVQKATKLAVVTDNSFDMDQPVFGSVSWRNLPAWQVMEQLTQSPAVKGRWEKSKEGYRLVAIVPLDAQTENPSPPKTEKPESHPEGSTRWWLVFVGSLCLLGLGYLAVRFGFTRRDGNQK